MPEIRKIIAAVTALVPPAALAAAMITGSAVTSIASTSAGPAAAPQHPCFCAAPDTFYDT